MRRYSRSSTILHTLATLCITVATTPITGRKQYDQVKTFYADLIEDGALSRKHPLFELTLGIKDQLNKYHTANTVAPAIRAAT